MTEEEKLLAGKLFSPQSRELRDIKHKAHEACREYNMLDEYDQGRRDALIRSILGGCGRNCYIQGPVQFNYGSHVFIGDDFFANYNFTVVDDNRIFIGDRVMFAPNVSLVASSHPLIPEERNGEFGFFAGCGEEIHIGDDVWLACGVTVVGGVHIGNGSVIGANSVVLHDIPAGVLAAGNPCRVIRPITKEDSLRHLIVEDDEG